MELIRHHYSVSEQYVRKAMPYFKKMHGSPPDSGHHPLGFVLNAQGHFDEAIAEYQTVIHFFQKPYSIRERIVIRTSLEFLGCIYGYKGDLEKGFALAQIGLAF